MNKKLLIIGLLIIDEIRDAVKNEAGKIIPGGAGLFSSLAASFIEGVAPHLFSRYGKDYPGEVINRLEDKGVSLKLAQKEESPGPRCIIEYCSEGKRTVAFAEEAMAPRQAYLVEQDIDVSLWDGLHLTPGPYAIQKIFLEKFSKQNPKISLTLDPIYKVKEQDRSNYLELIRDIPIFLPSEQEVNFLFHCSIEEFCRSYQGESTVIVKAGENGAYLLNKGEVRHFPSYQKNARPVTGAGDSFCGAFHAAFLKTQDLDYAIEVGHSISSLLVEASSLNSYLELGPKDAIKRINRYRKRV